MEQENVGIVAVQGKKDEKNNLNGKPKGR